MDNEKPTNGKDTPTSMVGSASAAPLPEITVAHGEGESSDDTSSEETETSDDDGEEEVVEFRAGRNTGLRGSRTPTPAPAEDREDYTKTFDSLGELVTQIPQHASEKKILL